MFRTSFSGRGDQRQVKTSACTLLRQDFTNIALGHFQGQVVIAGFNVKMLWRYLLLLWAV